MLLLKYPTHVNAILTSMNVPAVSESTLRSREWEVGPVIENVGKISCLEALERKKCCWVSENIYQEPSSRNVNNIAIGASYDTGLQKRRKRHNRLTGKCSIHWHWIALCGKYSDWIFLFFAVNTAIGYFFIGYFFKYLEFLYLKSYLSASLYLLFSQLDTSQSIIYIPIINNC